MEKGCKAALLFHSSTPWTPEKQKEWVELTGEKDCTTKSLCNFLRRMLL
jgi:hypothetical protein